MSGAYRRSPDGGGAHPSRAGSACRASPLLGLALLAACHRPPAASGHAGSAPPPLPDAAVIATNEPFWQANIGAQTLALTGFRASAQVLRVVSMRDDRAGRHWLARGDGGGEVEASVAPIACLDSLSGEALPYLATLRIGHVTAGGCARAADTGGDAEIPAAFTGRWAPDPLACAEPGRDPDGLVIGTRSIALRGETATPSAIAVPTLSRITMTIEQGGRALDLVLLLDASGRHLTMTGAGPALNRLRCQDP